MKIELIPNDRRAPLWSPVLSFAVIRIQPGEMIIAEPVEDTHCHDDGEFLFPIDRKISADGLQLLERDDMFRFLADRLGTVEIGPDAAPICYDLAERISAAERGNIIDVFERADEFLEHFWPFFGQRERGYGPAHVWRVCKQIEREKPGIMIDFGKEDIRHACTNCQND